MRLPLCVCLHLLFCFLASVAAGASPRPNILLAISDDQSFAHTSIAGYPAIQTPAFDRVAREGVLFTGAICGSPGCSPSRASLLTGRYPWQIEHAGTHASSFPASYAVYPELLEQAGYFVGYTGKGWGPGNWKISGRQQNPAGESYSSVKSTEDLPQSVNKNDYAGNFAAFLKARPAGKPFCFWYGATEPHRAFEAGIGLKRGKKLADADLPGFLPDTPEVRSDLLDYCVEIEHFDEHLGRMLKMLEEAGELDQTLVVVTSDNGMAFPAAKANCYEYGIHVPLAIRWPAESPGNRVVDDLVGFVDLAPTFLEIAGLDVPEAMTGSSLFKLLRSGKQEQVEGNRDQIFSARERHSSSRYDNLAYPQRALRTHDYLLIRNFRPDRWPAGAPQRLNADGTLNSPHSGYHDIDACPTLSLLVQRRDDPQIAPYFHNAVDKRPEYELFDIRQDPGCRKNLAGTMALAMVEGKLKEQLNNYLRQTKDPRILDGGEIFETYPRYSPIRKFPAPASSK
ncbi:sulfatase family protein [Lignipirellula cremea]|uniref:Arylsulfatase n=1 Tax=Lignipirellula cremea TaxID=2528010 RepID=A0A518DWI0_9BACT|nr:sulfatase [Lignipirellula cremea]QDU96196.1 Arylsulfatase [Lignipirellula cremea]